jgi:hypothetical protein
MAIDDIPGKGRNTPKRKKWVHQLLPFLFAYLLNLLSRETKDLDWSSCFNAVYET